MMTSSTNPSDDEQIAVSRQISPADRGDEWQSGRSPIGLGKRSVEVTTASVQINAHAKSSALTTGHLGVPIPAPDPPSGSTEIAAALKERQPCPCIAPGRKPLRPKCQRPKCSASRRPQSGRGKVNIFAIQGPRCPRLETSRPPAGIPKRMRTERLGGKTNRF